MKSTFELHGFVALETYHIPLSKENDRCESICIRNGTIWMDFGSIGVALVLTKDIAPNIFAIIYNLHEVEREATEVNRDKYSDKILPCSPFRIQL